MFQVDVRRNQQWSWNFEVKDGRKFTRKKVNSRAKRCVLHLRRGCRQLKKIFMLLNLQQTTNVVYIYGAPSKARNANVVYIWTYVWQRWKPSHSISCTIFQHWINVKCFPISEACVNTFPVSDVTLISYKCISVISLEGLLRSYFSLAYS